MTLFLISFCSNLQYVMEDTSGFMNSLSVIVIVHPGIIR